MSCKQPLANLDGIYIYGPNHFRQSWRQGRKFLKAIALTKLVHPQKLLNSSLLISQKIFSDNQKGALLSLVVQALSEVILPPENIQNPLLPLELRWCSNITISFSVRVPVLSDNRYPIRPSSSGIVLLRTTVPGMSLSCTINQEYTTFPISRLTRRLQRTQQN